MANTTSSSKKRKRPKIGIGGYFGYGNYGDELFLEVFKEHLGRDFELEVLPNRLDKPYFAQAAEDRVDGVDAVLIGGGDLVQPWSIDPRYFHSAYLRKNVFLAGLGVPIRAGQSAQVEKPHIIERYKKFFGHPNVRFINVRDKQSADWVEGKLNPAAKVIESPDLVCGLTLPRVHRDPANPILGIVTRHRPGHELEDDYSRIEQLGAYAISEGWAVRHIILGSGLIGERDVVNAERVKIPGKSVIHTEDLWEMTRAIGECSALASMKFHGTVVATMYGIPSMVLVPTSKNRNFMRRMGRDDLLSRFDAEDLVDRFRPFPAAIDPDWVTRLRNGAVDMLDKLRDAISKRVAP
ncbi:polysaccharide pyruvyl transferase family protein [Kumtagia ephedrae]|nr:polysaccharide pyruvyl transferase family protein [Mesorhizobium ephedrae]